MSDKNKGQPSKKNEKRRPVEILEQITDELLPELYAGLGVSDVATAVKNSRELIVEAIVEEVPASDTIYIYPRNQKLFWGCPLCGTDNESDTHYKARCSNCRLSVDLYTEDF